MKPADELSALLQGKQLLIFDFDGTVADTSPLHAAAFAQVLEPLGIEVNYPAIAGMKTLDAMRKCLADAGHVRSDEDLRELVSAKQQAVRQMISKELSALPGVAEFLHWARPRYRLAMYTSGSRGTVSLALGKLGYVDWFDPVICADDVQQAKPHPEGFLTVINRTGVSANKALVFEDSESGLVAAASAGLACYDIRSGMFQDWKCDANIGA